MRTMSELFDERRRWTDDGAAAFLKNIILPRCHKPARIAADAAPARTELQLATLETGSWASVIDAAAMTEASRRADCFAGVTHTEGLRREREYLERHEGSAHA